MVGGYQFGVKREWMGGEERGGEGRRGKVEDGPRGGG
jgi:hypothetical protein